RASDISENKPAIQIENEKSKHKIKLKDRTYQYSIKMIEFLDNL
ncbi:unnamed protein product, partial [marine sediment metagenome]